MPLAPTAKAILIATAIVVGATLVTGFVVINQNSNQQLRTTVVNPENESSGEQPVEVAATGSVTSRHEVEIEIPNDATPGTKRFKIGIDTNGDGTADFESREITVQVSDGQTNQAPVVDAGSNQTVVLPGTATLAGSVSDDGLPNPPGNTTNTWSKKSGPGTVAFSNPSILNPTATFSAAGTYVLELSATDSELTGTDTMTVVVQEDSSEPPVDGGNARIEGDIDNWKRKTNAGSEVTIDDFELYVSGLSQEEIDNLEFRSTRDGISLEPKLINN